MGKWQRPETILFSKNTMGRPDTTEHSQPDAQPCNGPAGPELCCCIIHCKHSRATRFFFFSGHVHEPEFFFLHRRVFTLSANNTQRTKCCRTEDARSVTNGFRFRSVSDLHSLARDSETIKNACYSSMLVTPVDQVQHGQILRASENTPKC